MYLFVNKTEFSSLYIRVRGQSYKISNLLALSGARRYDVAQVPGLLTSGRVSPLHSLLVYHITAQFQWVPQHDKILENTE